MWNARPQSSPSHCKMSWLSVDLCGKEEGALSGRRWLQSERVFYGAGWRNTRGRRTIRMLEFPIVPFTTLIGFHYFYGSCPEKTASWSSKQENGKSTGLLSTIQINDARFQKRHALIREFTTRYVFREGLRGLLSKKRGPTVHVVERRPQNELLPSSTQKMQDRSLRYRYCSRKRHCSSLFTLLQSTRELPNVALSTDLYVVVSPTKALHHPYHSRKTKA